MLMTFWFDPLYELGQTAPLALLHSERPNLYAILAFLSATGFEKPVWLYINLHKPNLVG